MTTRDVMAKGVHVWLPSVRAGSGADVYVERLAAGLRRYGASATITWFDHRFEFLPSLMSRARLPAGVNVIHANAGCAFAFTRWNLPLVVTDHHYVLDSAYRPYKSALQHVYHKIIIGPSLHRSYRHATEVTTDSQFTARVLMASGLVASPVVIPLWADYDEFSPATVIPERRDGPFRLLFVGNNSRRKGADLITPLARMLGNDIEIHCTAGLRSGQGIAAEPNVVGLGRLSQQQLVAAYRDCDAVLLLSRYEGFGYTALEAMACGRPVVGFACGAIEEVVEHGETGLLAPVDDLVTLADGIRRLSIDRELGDAMGARGRRRAIGTFSEEAGVQSYIAVYTQAMRSACGP